MPATKLNMSLSLSLLSVLLWAPTSGAEDAPVSLEGLPANRWVTIRSGGAVTRTPARLVWLADRREGFVWSTLNIPERKLIMPQRTPGHIEGWFFPLERGHWMSRQVKLDGEFHNDVSGSAYVYLPGIRKVLFVHPSALEHPKRPSGLPAATGWLYDPEAGAWTRIRSEVSMADRPADFGAPVSQGYYWESAYHPRISGEIQPTHNRVPIGGAVVYDALNKEAVFFGGGGTWGRVGSEKEKVGPGDWIFDEALKRVRRLTADDAGRIAEARKWYPGHCGTWLFSEKDLSWRPLPQPLREQPSGRILPAMAYDAARNKIVLFGGDDYTRCLQDTWIYDCATRTWREVRPDVAPPPRACAGMVGVPGQNAALLVGGYGPGWKGRTDAWVYRVAENRWTRLAAELPVPAPYCSADFDPKTGATLVLGSNAERKLAMLTYGLSTRSVLHALRLDLASAPVASPPAPSDPSLAYHCKADILFRNPLPEEFLGKENAGPDPAAGRKALAELPANTWVHQNLTMPSKKAREDIWQDANEQGYDWVRFQSRGRTWGAYAYDARTHKVLAWGGGHTGYHGNDVHEYDVIANRWRAQTDPTAYRPRWYQHVGGGILSPMSKGVSFQGWRLMNAHSCRSFGVDARSDSLISVHGDVYSLKHHQVVGNIGFCPGDDRWVPARIDCSTPHGLYSFDVKGAPGPALHRADVAAKRWELVAKGGPTGFNHTYNHICYDSRRDRLIYFHSVNGMFGPKAPRVTTVWTFDFKTKIWSEEKPDGPEPLRPAGTSAYVPELDAAFVIFAPEAGLPETLYFYKVGERKWFTAPYRGRRVLENLNGLNHSAFYDPELKLLIRAAHSTEEVVQDNFTQILVMRLDPQTLELSPFRGP